MSRLLFYVQAGVPIFVLLCITLMSYNTKTQTVAPITTDIEYGPSDVIANYLDALDGAEQQSYEMDNNRYDNYDLYGQYNPASIPKRSPITSPSTGGDFSSVINDYFDALD